MVWSNVGLAYVHTFVVGGKTDLSWVIRAISIAVGINAYLLIYRVIYGILIRNYDDFAS